MLESIKDEDARREAEAIEREMDLLQRRGADTQLQTRNALRRVALVLVTMALVALLLYVLQS